MPRLAYLKKFRCNPLNDKHTSGYQLLVKRVSWSAFLQDVVGDQAELTLSLIDGTHLNSSVSIVPAPFVALEYRNFMMAL